MARTRSQGSKSPRNTAKGLLEKYPASVPCSCQVCLAHCARPGWWTVEQAAQAIDAGYAERMMLEVSPELTFGVLAPAFKGAEGRFALNDQAGNGCTFLVNDRCELFGTGHQPLECRFCHHDRLGQGPQCHADIEKDWQTIQGRQLITRWSKLIGSSK